MKRDKDSDRFFFGQNFRQGINVFLENDHRERFWHWRRMGNNKINEKEDDQEEDNEEEHQDSDKYETYKHEA